VTAHVHNNRSVLSLTLLYTLFSIGSLYSIDSKSKNDFPITDEFPNCKLVPIHMRGHEGNDI